ncbi:hypothetical protein B4U80_07311, partial [Leptotrombidium deliense]
PSFESTNLRKNDIHQIEKALGEDPNIFEYDAVYESFKSETKAETKAKIPRYVPKLLLTAENRKKEQERRLERKIQKEREEEGDQFKDKEAFVTGAYKEKIIELEAEKEKEAKEKYLEELMDVKKQRDLSGFYKHLLNQETTEHSEKPTEVVEKKQHQFSTKKISRNLRSRARSSSESSNSPERYNEPQDTTPILHKSPDITQRPSLSLKPTALEKNSDEIENVKVDEQNEKFTAPISNSEKKEKIDRKEYITKLFVKRTVGAVFEDKKNRYLIRKQSLKH